MHVTRVELENIKSHRHADFTFARGTTAITGENGAGKTTILEAIAWALFDTLDYSKDDFLRRGAKKGSVRVSFESDLDERQYTVYRDTGTGYYVFDHGLQMRIAEKKTDVGAFLRQHLGIEPGTDLKALFRSAIGVPQGSFTAEFILPASTRKAAFDRLLKVEEYRDGADRLRDTVKLIGDRTTDVRTRIANAEGQLARYDELVKEHEELSRQAGELLVALDALRTETEQRAVVVAAMDAAELLVTETRAQRDRLTVERDAATRRRQDRQSELDAAAAAAKRQRELTADYQAHLSALELIKKLETKRAARDRLQTEATRVDGLVLAAKGDVRRITDALEKSRRAGASAAALEPLITEQGELERERERLRELRAQALSARAQLVKLDKELEALRKQHALIRERVKEAEKGGEAAPRITELESERLHIETTLSSTEKAATSLKHLSAQRKDVAREAERLRKDVAAREKEIAEFERRSAKAVMVSELLAHENELTEHLARLRAELARDEKFQAEVKGGLCPILSERCLNIPEGQTLADYFKGQLATGSAQLKALEQERATAGVAVREAREAEKQLSKLESARAQIALERKTLNEREAALIRLDQEINALPTATRELLNQLRAKLSGIDGELITLREAALRYAELKPLQQRLQEIEREGKARREEREGLAAASEAVLTLEKEIEGTEKRLRVLQDPRGRAAGLRAEAELAAALETELTGTNDALRALELQSKDFAAQLAQYKQLDDEWDAARTERDRTDGAHREYLAGASLAATLPAREAALKQAADESARIAAELERAVQEHDRAAAAYVRETHTEERAQLARARERAAAQTAQLEAAQTRAQTLDAELTRLAQVRDSMRDEFRAKERLEDLSETTEFIRDTLKQAGPLVTESYLYNISIEANQLFREITGEAGRALRWSRDYEIILEEEGHERPFPSLSGGEQMAAALSVRLALLKQLSDIRLAFFDEPTVNMDAERRERLAQQIGQVRHFDQLFVISHDDTFEENVDHIVHVRREDVKNAV